MGSKQTTTGSITLDPLAVRNKADTLWIGIETQHRRLLERLPLDHSPGPRELAEIICDFDSYIGHVNRLVRLADLAQSEVPGVDLAAAVDALATACPHIREVRDTIEHFDAYSLGKGNRQKKGESISELLFTVYQDEIVLTYAVFTIPIARTTAASAELHHAIREAVDRLSQADAAWHSPVIEDLPNTGLIRSGAGLQRKQRHYPSANG